MFSKSRSRALSQIERQDRGLRGPRGFDFVVHLFSLPRRARAGSTSHRGCEGQRAVTRPMPRLAPVTRMTRPSAVRARRVAIEIGHGIDSRIMRAHATPLQTADSSVAG